MKLLIEVRLVFNHVLYSIHIQEVNRIYITRKKIHDIRLRFIQNSLLYLCQTIDRVTLVCFPDSDAFNRAMLMNVGYVEALKERPFDCFIFHDVDLLPENDRNLYTCPEQPRHMSVAVDKFNYRWDIKSIIDSTNFN